MVRESTPLLSYDLIPDVLVKLSTVWSDVFEEIDTDLMATRIPCDEPDRDVERLIRGHAHEPPSAWALVLERRLGGCTSMAGKRVEPERVVFARVACGPDIPSCAVRH